jgi:xyloglucan-specific exo-beta-1,4-glucanase
MVSDTGIYSVYLDCAPNFGYVNLVPAKVICLVSGFPSYSVDNSVLILFPNPTRDIVNIKIDGDEKGTYKLTNSLGQILISEDLEKSFIDLSSYADGIYFVTILSNKRNLRQKIVKNNS